MRDYGKVYTAFWSNEDVRAMSEDGRMLALYLMTCPHGNMLGCFRLPVAYVAEDLCWSGDRVSKGFDELFRYRFSYRCQRSSWLFIRNHLEWNPLENPNVGKAAAKLFDSLPMTHEIKALVARSLRMKAPHFPQDKLTQFETLSIPFQDPFETVSKPVAVTVAVEVTVAEAGNKPMSEQSPDECAEPAIERRGVNIEEVSNEAEVVTALEVVKKPRGDAGEDVRSVFTYWQQVMNHPRAQLDAKRQKAIKGRLKDGYSVQDLCLAIDGCSRSAYHMGQNEGGTVFDDIELICRDGPKVDSFIKKASIVPAAVHRTSSHQKTLDNLNAFLQEQP